MANTDPGFVLGQIPTAAQWNSYFNTKVSATSGTATGLTLTTPTINNATFNPPLSAAGGMPFINVKSLYNGYFDGASHPLSAIGLTAAQAAYPNIGLTGATNLTLYESDTAALQQAEYDARIGAGGILLLPDNGVGRLSNQLRLSAANKVWLWGGRNSTLISPGVAAGTPAIQVSHADTLHNDVPLAHFSMQALVQAQFPSQSAGGVRFTTYSTGAVAIGFDNCQGSVLDSIGWNGYDAAIAWNDNAWSLRFLNCTAQGNNYGMSWLSQSGLNSGERIIIDGGSYSNNNYGIYWDFRLTGGGGQGGSVFVQNASFDYNIVRAMSYWGTGNGDTSTGNSFHVSHCHIETTGACSGGALARCYSNGKSYWTDSEFYEGDGTLGPGEIEIGDDGHATAIGNSFNTAATAWPIFYSATTAPKWVEGSGNRYQAMTANVVILKDGNGCVMQHSTLDGTGVNINGVPVLTLSYQNKIILMSFFASQTMVLPNETNAPHAIGTVLQFFNLTANTYTTTFSADSGVTMNVQAAGAKLNGVGKRAYAYKYATNYWFLMGADLTP